MNTTTYDVLALEEIAKEKFDFSVEIQSIILPMSDVGRTAAASVFLTSKNHLAVYVEVSSAATLADIKKIVRRMGLKVEEFLPPKGQPNYFDDIGRERISWHENYIKRRSIVLPDAGAVQSSAGHYF